MSEPAMYLTDDRDLPAEDLRTLVIFQGGNGDWYVQVAPANGRTTEGVRICTSGGAQMACPGLGPAIADAYRAMRAAQEGQPLRNEPTRQELLDEIEAWRQSDAGSEIPTHSTPPGYRLQPIAEYDAAAAMIRQHADLVVLVRRLSKALAQLDPTNPTAGGALRYLERIGEKGHVLR